MRCSLIFLHIFLFIFNAQAYPDFEWNKGAIVVATHEVVTGEVSYDPSHDIVLLRSEGKIQTFSADQVNYFHIINDQTGQVRRYVALPHATRVHFFYKRDYFFEIILSGEITFLRKTNKKAGFLRHANRSKPNQDTLCYDYFMLHDEKLIHIKHFEKDALPLLTRENAKSIDDYIEKRNIKKFTPRNQLVVIFYYNSTHKADEAPLVQRMKLSE